MKAWLKKTLIGILALFVLIGLSLIIAWAIVSASGPLKSKGYAPVEIRHGNNAETVEQMKLEQIRLKQANLINAESTHNLDDMEHREDLEEKGLRVKVGQKVDFKIKENASTGFSWSADPNGCSEDNHIAIDSTYGVAPPVENEKEIRFDRDGNMIVEETPPIRAGAPGYRVFSLNPLSKGQCLFRIAYFRPWEFNWEDQESNSKWPIVHVEIPIVIE